MTKSVTIAQARQADQHTIKTIGIPSLVLMERAALGATARLQPDTFDLTHVLVFAGTGNNGGDGLAIARMLHVRGIDVTVMLTGDAHKTSVETGQQLAILSYYHIPIIPASTDLTGYTTIVDAIFGIGLDRPVSGKFADWVNAINASSAPVLSVDVPSGLNADTGEPQGATVQATATSTFAYAKQGFLTDSGQQYTGQLFVEDIGVYLNDRAD
ncbi:YjeF-like protein [Secundilactobacillus odoratitofui DSM 19909 = JCM 15043]|uniref:NAD(P)H-hydrate epimerase n=1 Tax=Secundilactobacillus odoratitofui DSM 19909 = JCM 15043 TaxID=1423776 RepID=A0A0R1M4N7_9LACO|nr:NAD(P)H-hydrate epimerase [Secundilactobacillus odoratitofui]KRK98807.1 YjeF-like protein [Secundilactobacillus odoratitofui DSM 19909 = JCM 15043]